MSGSVNKFFMQYTGPALRALEREARKLRSNPVKQGRAVARSISFQHNSPLGLTIDTSFELYGAGSLDICNPEAG